MAEITKVPPLPSGHRPETGPMQFGDDWPGIFIRGDNALADANMLEQALRIISEHAAPDDWIARSIITGMIDTLRSCSVGDTGWPPSSTNTPRPAPR